MTRRSQIALGLVAVTFAILVLGVWIPLDTDTGLIEKVRRRSQIGDALAPTLAAVFVLVGGVLVVLRPTPSDEVPTPGGLRFGGRMLALLILGFVVMLYAGPGMLAIYSLTLPEPLEYRLMRGDFPWKYIGFVLGGVIAIAGPIALAEGRLTGRAILIGLGSVLGMVALFDLPFDDLLLPPNGDW